jgi:hypothetical protein
MRLITEKDITVPVTVQTRTALPPDRAFQPAVDLSLVFKGWGPFPAVRDVRNQTGAWDHAGVSRNPILSDGSMATEKLTEYMAGHSFAYEVTDLASVDFFVVTTATFRVLYVFVVLLHRRRRVVLFNVTNSPTATWTARQIIEAFPDDSAPR